MAPKPKKVKGGKNEKGASGEKKGKAGHVQAYGDEEYWNKRYTEEPATFDWYQKYADLQTLITMHIPKTARNLIVGCGNAAISEEMVKDGYTEIVNVDSSSVCLELMNAKFKGVEEFAAMTFLRQDIKDLKMFKDLTIDNVLDKGLLDSILCGANAPENVKQVLSEIRRVMKPQCNYMLVTYGDPRSRMPYLKTSEFQWQIVLYVIPRPGSMKGTQKTSRKFTDPVYMLEDYTLGPQFNLDDPDWHYVYVCTKELPAPKELPAKGKKDAKGKKK